MSATVRDSAEGSRYEIVVDGEVAGFADYHLARDHITFTHLEVSDEYTGRGLARQLTIELLADAEHRGLGVVPLCPYVRKFISRNAAQYLHLVPEGLRERLGLDHVRPRRTEDASTRAGGARLGLPAGIRACLFDLDGVLTQTAAVHRAAWKETFDPILAEAGQAPFTEEDYLRHVDGKRRLDGVRDFLVSRGLTPPEGSPDDQPDRATIHGIGSRKNELVLKRLAQDGVETYSDAVTYLHEVRAAGLPVGVVTASANAEAVLRAAHLTEFVDARIDGLVAGRDGLAGKPAPDTFLAGAKALGVEPGQAVVFEDALSGVAAGRAGNFGFVVGVDRVGQGAALREHGADVVVTDLTQLLENHQREAQPGEDERGPEA
jgi:beta-phosphoglucomutase family hydrolase